jgi:Dienelactone hydrolase and related enzymes
MTTDKHDPENAQTANVSRRDFIARSVAAGLVAATGQSFAATLPVVETEVTVRTPDGTCDAAFIHPASGGYPGVIVWADALGLRPAMRDMAKRLAASGYSVLVPNPFYRVSKAPQFTTAANLDFKSPDLMTKIGR